MPNRVRRSWQLAAARRTVISRRSVRVILRRERKRAGDGLQRVEAGGARRALDVVTERVRVGAAECAVVSAICVGAHVRPESLRGGAGFHGDSVSAVRAVHGEAVGGPADLEERRGEERRGE